MIGFLANGLTFVSGEHDVDRALGSVRQATALADASREFKSAVGDIQAAARSFAVSPRPSYLQTLSDAQAVATAQFITIRHLSSGAGQTSLDAIERTLARLQENFTELRNEYERLGADGDTGIRSKLRKAAAEVERIIGLDMSWLTEATAHQLTESLLSMRRFEAAYMLDRNPDDARASTPSSASSTRSSTASSRRRFSKSQIVKPWATTPPPSRPG